VGLEFLEKSLILTDKQDALIHVRCEATRCQRPGAPRRKLDKTDARSVSARWLAVKS
jgi:hypothetical protein